MLWKIYLMVSVEFYIMMFAATLLFLTKDKLRPHPVRNILLSALICLAGGVFPAWFTYISGQYESVALQVLCWAASYLLLSVFVFLSLWLTYEISTASLVYDIINGFATEHFSECIFFLIVLYTDLTAIYHSQSFMYYFIRLIVRAVIYPLIYFIFIRNKGTPAEWQKPHLPVLYFCLFLYFFAFTANIVRTIFADESIVLNSICLLSVSVFCLMILIVRSGLLERDRAETELSTMTKIYEERKKQLMLSKKNAELISIKYHDLRHQLAAMQQSRLSPQATLDEIDEAMNIYDSVIHTGNETLDAVLTDIRIRCERLHIRFTSVIDGKKADKLSSVDIVALFSNALDNAINAVRDLPADERLISLFVGEQKGMLRICVENQYEGRIEFRSDLPVTQKADTSVHGFGMKSIKLIAEKYNGVLTIKTDNNIFKLSILIPL